MLGLLPEGSSRPRPPVYARLGSETRAGNDPAVESLAQVLVAEEEGRVSEEEVLRQDLDEEAVSRVLMGAAQESVCRCKCVLGAAHDIGHRFESACAENNLGLRTACTHSLLAASYIFREIELFC